MMLIWAKFLGIGYNFLNFEIETLNEFKIFACTASYSIGRPVYKKVEFYALFLEQKTLNKIFLQLTVCGDWFHPNPFESNDFWGSPLAATENARYLFLRPLGINIHLVHYNCRESRTVWRSMRCEKPTLF